MNESLRLRRLGAGLALVVTACRGDGHRLVEARNKEANEAPRWEQPLDGRRYVVVRPTVGYPCDVKIVHDRKENVAFAIGSHSVRKFDPDIEPISPVFTHHQFDRCVPDWARTRSFDQSGDGFRRYVQPSSALLERILRPETDLYWMSGTARTCERVRVSPQKGTSPNRSDPGLSALSRFPIPHDAALARLVLVDGETLSFEDQYWYPVALVPPREGYLGYLLFGTPQNGVSGPALHCLCERLLRILHVDEREIHLAGRYWEASPPADADSPTLPTKPDEVVAYDVGDVERWFWTKESCEVAREDAVATILRDARMSLRVGVSSHVLDFLFVTQPSENPDE